MYLVSYTCNWYPSPELHSADLHTDKITVLPTWENQKNGLENDNQLLLVGSWQHLATEPNHLALSCLPVCVCLWCHNDDIIRNSFYSVQMQYARSDISLAFIPSLVHDINIIHLSDQISSILLYSTLDYTLHPSSCVCASSDISFLNPFRARNLVSIRVGTGWTNPSPNAVQSFGTLARKSPIFVTDASKPTTANDTLCHLFDPSLIFHIHVFTDHPSFPTYDW